jgi:hypothetical protein
MTNLVAIFGPRWELMKDKKSGVEGACIPSPRPVYCIAVHGAEYMPSRHAAKMVIVGLRINTVIVLLLYHALL